MTKVGNTVLRAAVYLWIFLTASLALSACAQVDKGSVIHKSALKKSQILSHLVVRVLDTMEFRRSYHVFEHTTDEEANRQMVSDPVLSSSRGVSKELWSTLNNLGITHGDSNGHRLRLSRFDETDSLLVLAKGKAPVRISFYRTNTTTPLGFTEFQTSKAKVFFESSPYFSDKSVCLAEVVPGGYKEILVCQNWYIANGDNYDLIIYEVDTR